MASRILKFPALPRRRTSPMTSFLLQLFALMIFTVSSTHGGCKFPLHWAGRWFQSGLQPLLTVNSSFMETKGECQELQGDKFIIFDRSEDCYRCIVIHEKHPSVLQYKESECDRKTSLKSMCESISGDAQLYSMFRQQPPPKPQSCPFRVAPFTFTYNRGSGDCVHPVSRAESCMDDSRLLLKYQACPDVPSSESNVEELVCLATWKEGSTRYLVGKISQFNRRMSDEDSFRCFVYKGQSNGGKMTYDIAQSGDATCNGLISSTEGSRTMKLTTVDNHHNRCKFPSWITEHHTWHSLDHTRTYHFSHRNATLKISNEDGSGNEMRLVCHSILMQPADNKLVQIVAHVTQECNSGHVCMMFHKRDTGVIEVQHPEQRYDSPDDACRTLNESTPYTTLVTGRLDPKPCPHLGRYTVFDSLAENRKRRQQLTTGVEDQESTQPAVKECPASTAFESLAIGCSGAQDTMEFKSACSVRAYSCHGSWSEGGTHFLIASPQARASTDPRRYCFMYTMNTNNNDSLDLSQLAASGRGGKSRLAPRERATLRLSAVAVSCNRLDIPGVTGDNAYNLTINGTCAQSSEYSSGSSGLISQLLTVMAAVLLLTNAMTTR